MKTPYLAHPRITAILLAATLAGGCASVSDPTRFYTLHPVQAMDAQPSAASGPAIGLGPVYFPRLLNRRQIVTRRSNNEVQLADFHQWGGSLEEDFSRVLAANLAARTRASVYVFPWESRTKPDTQIRLSVDRFDGALGEEVRLEGQWQIVPASPPLTRRFALSQPVQGNDYAAYVEAMSQVLDQVAAHIAAALASTAP